MTLLKDNNYKDINVALLSLEADIKNKITNFDTSVIDKQLAEINSRIDKINVGSNNTSAQINDIRYEIEDINSKLKGNSAKIENIEQKLSDIFSAENKVTDFNTTTNSGIYYWATDAANKPDANYGVLLVNKYDSGSTNIWINQIAYGTNNKIYFRQNINSGNWTEWKAVAFDGEITANKVANALTVNGKTYDGSEAVDAGVQKIENGGTGVTTQADINKAFIGNLNVGNDNVTDGTEFVSSWASDNGFADPSGLNKPYKRQFIKVWNYIKGKISSVLGLTKDNYGGTAATILDYNRNTPIKVRWGGPGIDSAEWYPAFSADGSAIEPISRNNIHAGTADTAGTANTANKIVPKYTTKYLTTVTSETTKYIKVADCRWNQTGTLQVLLEGNAFQDTLVINFGGGHATHPILCGYYISHRYYVISVIAQKGTAYDSNYSIYVKINQLTTCTVKVALLKGDCTINITESTTAPTNIFEWPISDGFFGDLTGNVTGNVTGSSGSAGKLTTARTAYVDLGTASTTRTIDWSGDTTIPVDGVLQVEHGGTGCNTAEGAANSLIANLPASQEVPVDADYFISQHVNGGPFVPAYQRRPVSKLWEYIKDKILQEGEDFGYNHIVHDDASLLEWANCTDGSMKKVLVKSGTYNMTKGVDFSKAGTGYVFAENGAVINSKVPIAFSAPSGKTAVHNLSVICGPSSDNSCAFSANDVLNLILYDCEAGYATNTITVNRNLFSKCTCYNCHYNFTYSSSNSSMSTKVFYQCYCYNCICKQTIAANSSSAVSFATDSFFYKECVCVSCDADLTTLRNIKAATPSFSCYYNCWDRCVGCLSKINVGSSALTVYSTLYGFMRCQHMSSCKETHTVGYSNIKGVVQCIYVSSTSAVSGESNTNVGNSCDI